MSRKTKIVQCFTPPLVAGVFDVSVTQQIKKKGAEKPLEDNIAKKLQFGVDAARFTLNSADVYSVYPPANQFGNYSEALPHVVFTRRTLPWERTVDGKPPVFQRTDTAKEAQNPQASPPVPWMAVILFDEDEMKTLKIENRTVANVITTSTDDKVTRPEIFNSDAGGPDALKLMQWERTDDGCMTVDITKEQFYKYVPGMEDMSYLAHAKEVSIADKDKEGITDLNKDGDTGIFSVVVGNRLPVKGKQHTAILVSLEGYQNYLAPRQGATPAKTIKEGNKVRLVVLANWNFRNSGDASFLELIKGLDIKKMQITNGLEDPEFATELSPYYDAGYVPLEHLTRNGATTLSWYHGPFLPKQAPRSSMHMSFSSADGALRYDKATGFFDISYAGAWQLGRMLALQNQGFSKAMLNWRIARKQFEVRDSRNKKVSDILNDTSSLTLKNKVVKYLGGSTSLSVAEQDLLAANSYDDIPPEVLDFLGNLYHLNGVPFNYLVPHEFFLEKKHELNQQLTGSLAFFYVDLNWVEAMMDGALSIGRLSNTDDVLSKAMLGPELGNKLNVTGFLLRSDLISGWRGIEIEAFDADGVKLKGYRFERVDEDIFLGIFNGNVASIVITQPYEGLHFGIKNDSTGYAKNLKNEDGTNQKITDGTADVNKELNAGMVKDGVVQVAALARCMRQKLIDKKNWMTGTYFTSAEFAYQMVDSPVKHKVTVDVSRQ